MYLFTLFDVLEHQKAMSHHKFLIVERRIDRIC